MRLFKNQPWDPGSFQVKHEAGNSDLKGGGENGGINQMRSQPSYCSVNLRTENVVQGENTMNEMTPK